MDRASCPLLCFPVYVICEIGGLNRSLVNSEDAIGSVGERLYDKRGVDAPGTHHANTREIRRVLHAVGVGEIGSGVRAPAAQKSHDSRLGSFSYGH